MDKKTLIKIVTFVLTVFNLCATIYYIKSNNTSVKRKIQNKLNTIKDDLNNITEELEDLTDELENLTDELDNIKNTKKENPMETTEDIDFLEEETTEEEE